MKRGEQENDCGSRKQIRVWKKERRNGETDGLKPEEECNEGNGTAGVHGIRLKR
jgi:hypothetical protein